MVSTSVRQRRLHSGPRSCAAARTQVCRGSLLQQCNTFAPPPVACVLVLCVFVCLASPAAAGGWAAGGVCFVFLCFGLAIARSGGLCFRVLADPPQNIIGGSILNLNHVTLNVRLRSGCGAFSKQFRGTRLRSAGFPLARARSVNASWAPSWALSFTTLALPPPTFVSGRSGVSVCVFVRRVWVPEFLCVCAAHCALHATEPVVRLAGMAN